jgi:hypothetical protein
VDGPSEQKQKVPPPPKEEVVPAEKPKPAAAAADVGEKKENAEIVDDKSNADRNNGPERNNDYLYKRGAKAPGATRRNPRGGSRLQGYGPPSDRKPFSSNNSKQVSVGGGIHMPNKCCTLYVLR